MHIYVVNGYPGSGKTTFEEIIKEINGAHSTFIYSTITPIIEAAKGLGFNINDWKKTKSQKDRAFLSELKALSNKYYDFTLKDIDKYLTSKEYERELGADTDKFIVFIDSREPNEIKRICEEFGAKSILIVRDAHISPQNSSDAQVMNYKYDFVIYNNGTIGDLKRKAIMFLGEETIDNDPIQLSLF